MENKSDLQTLNPSAIDSTALFCIVKDDSGHRWICPVSERENVEASIQATEEYWRNEDYSHDPPRDLTEILNLPLWEGDDLTFAFPHFDGKPIFK